MNVCCDNCYSILNINLKKDVTIKRVPRKLFGIFKIGTKDVYYIICPCCNKKSTFSFI